MKYYRFEANNGQLRAVRELTPEEYADDPSPTIDLVPSEPVIMGADGRIVITLPPEIKGEDK